MVLVTVALLLLNAFFVGAEFAAMASRRSRLEPLAAAGHRRAQLTLQALEQMGSVLAAAQLGITLASVLLGAFTEAALHEALLPLAERVGWPAGVADGVALTMALLLVAYLHVVIGEMIPKNLAIAGPDRAALVLVPALFFITRLLGPFIRVMESAAKAIVRILGVEPKDEQATQFTAEEVAQIVDESHREGLVPEEHYARLGAALEFGRTDAGEVAVPVGELVTVTSEATPADIERLVAKRGFSRFPVVDASGDPVGYLHLKDVLYADRQDRNEPVPGKRVRRMATVGPGDEVEEVLETMRATGSHLARVVADDGGVLGVVFLEDVIEELVGEVSDSTQR